MIQLCTRQEGNEDEKNRNWEEKRTNAVNIRDRRGRKEESDEGNINRHRRASYTVEHEEKGIEARKRKEMQRTLNPVN